MLDLRKQVEVFLRAILYQGSSIVIACSTDKDARRNMLKLQHTVEQQNILQSEIKTMTDKAILFKNGSKVVVLKPEEKSEHVRGKRAEFAHWLYDFEAMPIDDEELDEVLKPFTKGK